MSLAQCWQNKFCQKIFPFLLDLALGFDARETLFAEVVRDGGVIHGREFP